MPPASVRPDAAFNIDQLLDENPKARQGFEWGRAIIELGARIKQARKAAGLSQQALAGRLATNQAYISELERGTGAQGPTYMMLLKIADACATTVQALIAATARQAGEIPETAEGGTGHAPVAVVAGYEGAAAISAHALRGAGYQVLVTEDDPIFALKAAMEGFEVANMEDAITRADIISTQPGRIMDLPSPEPRVPAPGFSEPGNAVAAPLPPARRRGQGGAGVPRPKTFHKPP